VWHDNSGKGKHGGWYLKQIVAHDLQTGDRFYFIANRWFAVEEDDGQVKGNENRKNISPYTKHIW